MVDNFKSDLSKARNLGSSKKGSHHWWYQRFTAIAFLPLTIWLILFMKNSQGSDQLLSNLKKPYNVAFAALFVGNAFYHAKLGMKVIIEDYISCLFIRNFLIVALNMFVIASFVFFLIALIYFMKF